MSETVKVMVRARPINQREINEGSKICVEIDKKINQVVIRKPQDPSEVPKAFTYDSVYDWNSSQRSVYDESAFPLVESVIEGYNGTIFAYGQTGCGKTHTMMGYKDDPEERGIIPNAFEHIFGFIDQVGSSGMKFLVRCSYLEIYNEDIRDLLGKNVDQKLDLKEDPNKGVFVKDLTCCIVKSIPEIEKLMHQGSGNRKVGETAMNKDSSRSHSIFTIYIETSEDIGNDESRIKAGKLNLVDLAGSERQSKTQAQGIRLKEATKINLSLSVYIRFTHYKPQQALGNVISALVDGKSQHIPYRDSKLTRLLQDSLGGNTKTVMIAAISPSDYNYDETLSTLRYASRAKSIKNKPRVNEDPKDALLKQYEDEIKKLKEMLEQASGGGQIQLDQKDFGSSLMKRPTQEHIMVGGQDETVDMLLEKLAKKGKKVKILEEESDDENQDTQQQFYNNRRTKESEGPGSIMEEENEDEVIHQDEDGINEDINIYNDNEQKGAGIRITKKGRSNGPLSVDKKSKKRTIIRDNLDQQNQQLQGQLQQIQSQETVSKDQLQKIIKEMEQRLVIGGQALDEDKERERIKQQRQLQIKLRNERKKQKQLLEEKQKQEEELLLKQQQYTSLQDEVEKNRAIIDKLRVKYKEHSSEVKDLQEEFEYQKQDMLDTIRDQEKELEFCQEVIKAMLRDHELQKLKGRAKYDDNNKKWVLPAFFIKEREVNLPKIRNAKALIEQELDKRELIFDDQQEYQDQKQVQKTNRADDSRKSNRLNGGGNDYKQAIIEARQSRIMASLDSERITPHDYQARSQPSVNKIKQQNAMSQNTYQTMNAEMEQKAMNKKNVRSNVTLKPLNYQTGNNNTLAQPLTNVDEVIKSQYLENHPLFSNQGQPMIKKGQLSKLQTNPANSIQLNVNPVDNQGNSFQMSIQATVSIEPTNMARRQQLAPITGQSSTISPVIQHGKANDIGQGNSQQNIQKSQQMKKNRVILKTLGSNYNNQE